MRRHPIWVSSPGVQDMLYIKHVGNRRWHSMGGRWQWRPLFEWRRKWWLKWLCLYINKVC
jgi:hypothetical protein